MYREDEQIPHKSRWVTDLERIYVGEIWSIVGTHNFVGSEAFCSSGEEKKNKPRFAASATHNG